MVPRPLAIATADKQRLRVLYVAKHARSRGEPHPQDGTHATYHAEMRSVLESIGLRLAVADSYDALFDPRDVDFVIPMLNRGGFLNSEMLLPLLCARARLPFLGASAIVRGLGDDKHLAKLSARARGVDTADWAVFRRGAAIDTALLPAAERWVVKPNASSASWGISAADDRAAVCTAVQALHAEGHDAIVEPFIEGHDIAVSVITVDGRPVLLPTMIVEQRDPAALRLYAEKRDLGGDQGYAIGRWSDLGGIAAVEAATRRLVAEYAPFDYGRFEFRIDVRTGAIRFLEVNLNCNLWSRKTISMAARLAGWSHCELIETIVAESMRRQGLIAVSAPAAPVWSMPARTRVAA